MSDTDSRKIPTRHGRGGGAPAGGLGSAYKENQRLAGAANPEDAARFAGDPEALEEARRRAQAQYEEAMSRIGWLAEQGAAGVAPKMLSHYNRADLLAFYERCRTEEARFTADELDEWVDDVKAQLKSAADKETTGMDVSEEEDEVDANVFRITPDDPLYDAMQDRERRKAIEAQLRPFGEADFEDLIFKGAVSQEVPVRKGCRLSFRTPMTLHNLWVEERYTDLRGKGDHYIQHWIGQANLALSLEAFNGKAFDNYPPLATYVEDTAQHKDAFNKALDARMARLAKFPTLLTDDWRVHMVWFHGRARAFIVGENVSELVGNS